MQPNPTLMDGLTLAQGDVAVVLPSGRIPRVRWVLTDPPWWGQVYLGEVVTPTPQNPTIHAQWIRGALAFYYDWMPHIPAWLDESGARCFVVISPDHWPAAHLVLTWMRWFPAATWVQQGVGTLVQFGVPLPRRLVLAVDDLWQSSLLRPVFDPCFVDTLMGLVPPDGTVGDPFAGTGATLFAAQRHGYAAVGVEYQDDLCEQILARWRTGQQPKPQVDSRPSGPGQET